jgi:hypothetical protein
VFRVGGSGRLCLFKAEALVSCAVAAVLWGWVVALLGFGWRFWCCVGGEVVDPAGSSSGYAKVVLVATSGRRPRKHGAWVATWISVWTASLSTRLVPLRAMRRLFWMVRRGGGPGARGVFVALVGCVVWMTGLLACAVFRLGFPYKPGNVWFLDPVSLINWVILCIALYLSNRPADSTAFSSKKSRTAVIMYFSRTEEKVYSTCKFHKTVTVNRPHTVTNDKYLVFFTSANTRINAPSMWLAGSKGLVKQQ